MITTWNLVSLFLLTSASPQNEGHAIFFPEEANSNRWENNENEYINRNAGDRFYDTFDEYDDSFGDLDINEHDYLDLVDTMDYIHEISPFETFDDPFAELEPNFAREDDFVELPDWMDTDLNELSLDKVAFLNNMTDLSDLAGFFDLDTENAAKLSALTNRSRNETGPLSVDDRSDFDEKNYKMAEFAKCIPEEVIVELPVPNKAMQLPSCIRLKRCGGCCNSALLSCQPTKVEEKFITVMKITKNNVSRRRFRRNRSTRRRRKRTSGQLIPMKQENHVECSCRCKIQEHHCDPLVHNYNKDSCACVCKDQTEQIKCKKSSHIHHWDKNSCTCMCRYVKECSTGEIFSQDTCGCLPAL